MFNSLKNPKCFISYLQLISDVISAKEYMENLH